MTRAEALEQLLAQAVLDLARPEAQALARKPAGRRTPDSLAVEFDDAYTAYVENLEQLPTDAQLESLQALDAALTAMTGPANRELWTESALKNHPRWAEIRVLARAATTHFGWS